MFNSAQQNYTQQVISSDPLKQVFFGGNELRYSFEVLKIFVPVSSGSAE